MSQYSLPTLDLHAYSNDTLQEMFCVNFYLKFKRMPHPNTFYKDRITLINKIDLLRRHR